MHEERKQFAVNLVQELLRVNVGSKKHIDYCGAMWRLIETHNWPMHNCQKMLSERIQGWATGFDHAARVADTRAKKQEHNMETEALDPPAATRDVVIVAKI